MFIMLTKLLIIISLTISYAENYYTPIVETTLGTVIGSTVEVKGVFVEQFLGVPYAKPPTGDRRFKRPEPTTNWSEPLAAVTQPPACIQFTENPFPWYDNETGKSEDCLYLNIWVPSRAGTDNKKAVFFWIFGGGFFMGSIRNDLYAGDVLSAMEDIIVVTVNYRLGSFGFLYSGSSDAPGNIGLWDILTGLQWIHDHIEAFGGDETRVTLAGESAGSIAAGLLAVSPLANGLYARLYMQSGSPAYTMADDNTQSLKKSQKIAEIVGCANVTLTMENDPQGVVDCLRGVKAMDLIKAESSLIPHSSRSFLPRFGDEILPTNPRQAIINGNFWNTDALIGNNKDEGSFQVTTSNPDVFGFFGEKNPQINKTTAQNFLRKIFANFPDTEGVIEHYLPQYLEENDHEIIRLQLYAASGDFSLLCPTVFFAEKLAENGNKVYYQLWSYTPSTSPWAQWMGTPHFVDVEFLFGMPIKNPEPYSDFEIELSKQFMHICSNFMKYGKPLERWPLYSRENPKYLDVHPNPEWNWPGPHKENCDFFRPYFGF